MKFAVVVFPGSNCEQDAYHAAAGVLGQSAELVWHKETSLRGADVVILPGGFSYGDYLRTGAIARFSPVMHAVKAFAASGGPLLGICNGFQVLTEAGLLPGALMRNAGLSFVSRPVGLTVENAQSLFTARYRQGEGITIPVAHHDGNYQADAETLDRLEGEGRVAFRYAESVNGSARDIAGILDPGGNVLGMMPHPERMIEPAHGGTDGRALFESAVKGLVGA